MSPVLTRRQQSRLIADVTRVSCDQDGNCITWNMEAVMTAKEVKQTLVDEAKLLEHMIAEVNKFDGSGFTNQAKFIKDSWERFLDDRCQTNKSLAKANDYELVIDLAEEKCQVEQYVKATDSTAGYTEAWGKFLTCERDILKKLLDRARNGKSAP